MFLSTLLLCTLFSLSAQRDVKIVGGTEVKDRSQFAYQALLLYYGGPYCGGTIIDKKYILTAGHCCYYREQEMLPSDVEVVVGNLNLTDRQIVKSVKAIHIHEEFNMDTLDNDLAIFELTEPFENWTETVSPIELNKEHVTSGDCIASGWGTTFSGSKQMSSKLLYVSVPVIDWAACYEFYGAQNIHVNNKSICAGALEKDSCQGDSGGPFVCQNKLTGVVSYGIGCGYENFPGVYVEVAKYSDWLKNYTSSSTSLKLATFCLVTYFVTLINV
ncbi:trypsin alpha-3-like [Tribolium madens]|uniref:trypsin alpha-3-like n=1 Tax=Tribolium madens TaxID=41895 RepID=UPI001CF7538C|nr:trypsin alpha-3-like [Tribolium madens]